MLPGYFVKLCFTIFPHSFYMLLASDGKDEWKWRPLYTFARRPILCHFAWSPILCHFVLCAYIIICYGIILCFCTVVSQLSHTKLQLAPAPLACWLCDRQIVSFCWNKNIFEHQLKPNPKIWWYLPWKWDGVWIRVFFGLQHSLNVGRCH